MNASSIVTVCRQGDLAFVLIDNPPVNATSTAVRAGLLKAVAEVEGARCAILMGAGHTFIAGGDMSEFDAPPREPHLPDVVQAIEDSEVPFLAALHGSILGGGFEIAMGCAWRIADVDARFGLPEVNVGLIPGAGGTQRAPRLIGMDAAMDMACSAKVVSATELMALGGLDGTFEGDVKTAANAFAANLPPRAPKVSLRKATPLPENLLGKKRASIVKRAKGQQSPILNFDALLWATDPFEVAQPRERALHLQLRESRESRALRHAFFAEREVSKPKALRTAKPREVTKLAIVGGGLMGAGIATAALEGGLAVTLVERDDAAAVEAQERVQGLVNGAVARGRLSPDAARKQVSRFVATSDYSQAGTAEVVIEAVFEDMEIKREVFKKVARVAGVETILATNTSYLDPREIFAGIANPSRCLGLHFFSPAHVMKLLEIVALPDTSGKVLATGFSLGKRLRKVPVLSGICDGFIGNRMLAEYRRLVEYLLADGALPQEIDAAARAMGYPMGPFELQDLTGLQIAWANRKRLAATRDPGQRYVTISDQLCEMDRLGQRAGKGWYDYPDGSREPRPSQVVAGLINDYARDQRITHRALSQEDIQSRILAVLANEGARIVEEGIAESDPVVDMVQIHGYAFPRWTGGPMFMAEETGWEKVGRVMAQLEAESPGSWALSERVKGGG